MTFVTGVLLGMFIGSTASFVFVAMTDRDEDMELDHNDISEHEQDQWEAKR